MNCDKLLCLQGSEKRAVFTVGEYKRNQEDEAGRPRALCVWHFGMLLCGTHFTDDKVEFKTAPGRRGCAVSADDKPPSPLHDPFILSCPLSPSNSFFLQVGHTTLLECDESLQANGVGGRRLGIGRKRKGPGMGGGR